MDHERTVFEGRAHVQLDLPALQQVRCHRRLEKTKPCLPVELGLVKRQVGVLQKKIRIFRRIRSFCDADARTDDRALAAKVIRSAQRIDNATGHRRRRKSCVTGGAEDYKLVAPKAGYDVGCRSAMAEASRYDPKQGITSSMP